MSVTRNILRENRTYPEGSALSKRALFCHPSSGLMLGPLVRSFMGMLLLRYGTRQSILVTGKVCLGGYLPLALVRFLSVTGADPGGAGACGLSEGGVAAGGLAGA